ncbi:hypothetical protein DPMN_004611 [Dreissena polymorpha]|uniref:Uncharacterized protein n=1 Tax=Dreissena polymorpha TaxID=45954 RepID=A0A9D4MRW2_DREPO|nr:hypothetical protein DPMN_004611 [Dreissena polymorpha]
MPCNGAMLGAARLFRFTTGSVLKDALPVSFKLFICTVGFAFRAFFAFPWFKLFGSPLMLSAGFLAPTFLPASATGGRCCCCLDCLFCCCKFACCCCCCCC